MSNQKNQPNEEDLLLTGLYHPLGPGHFLIPLENEPKGSQGLRAQLVKLPNGWIYVVPELQVAGRKKLPVWKAKIMEYVNTEKAFQLARENGQELLFHLITQFSLNPQ